MHLMDKVRYLRTKGWVIYFMETEGVFMVGTHRMAEPELVRLWSREKARDEPFQSGYMDPERFEGEEAVSSSPGNLLPGGLDPRSPDPGDQ